MENKKAENIKVSVLGIGGGGGNAVQHMAQNIDGDIHFVALNTDQQALDILTVDTFLIGPKATKGLGSGGNPEIGMSAAKESSNEIQELLVDTDVCFIAAGLGGGTGTGASQEIASIARSMGILTIAVVTKPFQFEGSQRSKNSESSLNVLKHDVDSTIVVSNDKLLSFMKEEITLLNAFKLANDVLLSAVQSISDLIKKPGLINVDFNDVCSVVRDMGLGLISSASANGDLRAKTAIELALTSPLISESEVHSAKGIIVNITSGLDLKLSEYHLVNSIVSKFATDTTKVVLGTTIDPDMQDAVRVTLILTGVDRDNPVNNIKIIMPEEKEIQQEEPKVSFLRSRVLRKA
jgi:cell division protein FtsZ